MTLCAWTTNMSLFYSDEDEDEEGSDGGGGGLEKSSHCQEAAEVFEYNQLL